MKFVEIKKDGLTMEKGAPWQKTLKVGKKYLVSDLIHQQLMYIMPDHISKHVTPLEQVYRQYNGEDLNGKTLLIWRHGGIGDLLFMMPPLRLLKVKYPESKILVGIGGKYIDLYRHIPYVDEIHQLPFDIETLDLADYHLHFENIIEGNPRAEYTNAYDLFLEKFGFDPSEIPPYEKIADVFLNEKEKEWAEKIIKSWGINDEDILVGLQIAASSPIRTFPEDKTTQIANVISREPNGKVILFGSGAQKQLAEGIKKSLHAEHQDRIFMSAEYGFSLRQTMAITRHCDLVIAPDSAMIHIAGALRVPVIGLYGPFLADLRMRYYYDALALNATPACAPCFTHDHDPCKKGNPSPCFSLIDICQIMFAIELMLNKTGKKSMPDIKRLQKSIFNQVIDKAKPYMKGKGLDVGSGYQKYDESYDITRIDVNPLVDPDAIADFLVPNFEVDDEINYIISSYSVNTSLDLNEFMNKVNNVLATNGYLILYVGDSHIISKASGKQILSRYLLDYLKSELDRDIIMDEMKKFHNFELVEEDIPNPNALEEEVMQIFDTKYGIFQVWRKTHEVEYEKTS